LCLNERKNEVEETSTEWVLTSVIYRVSSLSGADFSMILSVERECPYQKEQELEIEADLSSSAIRRTSLDSSFPVLETK